MLLICISLTAISWLTQSLRFFDLIVNRGIEVSTFLYFSALLIPSLLWIIIPVALFISVTLAYKKLYSESELIVLKASGLNWQNLARPALTIAILAAILSYTIAFYLLPKSYREFKDMQYFIRDNYAALLLQEGVFTSPASGLTVYIRERGDDGMFHGLMVHDSRSEEKTTTMMATTGTLVKGPSGPRFILGSGNRQEVDRKTGESSILYFERYSLDLSLVATDKSFNRTREPEERYLSELLFPSDKVNDAMARKLQAEAHHRIVWPLYNILLALLALFPFLSGDHSRMGQTRRIITSSILAIGIVLWEFFMVNIVAKNPHITPVIYLSCFGFAAIFYWLLSDSSTNMLRRIAATGAARKAVV